MDSSKNIYNLKLHEDIEIKTNHGNAKVMRVPGGWMYMWESRSIFVPYSKNTSQESTVDLKKLQLAMSFIAECRSRWSPYH